MSPPVKRKHEGTEDTEKGDNWKEDYGTAENKLRKMETEDVLSGKPKATLFFVSEGIQGKRFQLMKNFAMKNEFGCEDSLSTRVTHVISELDSVSQIEKLYPQLLQNCHVKIVTSQWMYSSVRQKMLVSEENYLVNGYEQWLAENLQKAQTSSEGGSSSKHKNNGEGISDTQEGSAANPDDHNKQLFNDNILERNAKLEHHNMKLAEPLAFMNDYWTVMGDERRALAFAKAAATIKCLPFTVSTVEQVKDLKGLGTGHCLKVVEEFLKTGRCREVAAKAESEKYVALKNLTKVYGIGAGHAEKLYTVHNIRNVQDIITQWNQLKLADERIKYGIIYYKDLNTPVTRHQAEEIEIILREELDATKPGYTLALTGGFRRGKKVGHDVDFLISYGKDGEEVGVLNKLLLSLCSKGYILHQRVEKSTFDEESVFKKASERFNPMDHFEKCFCIFRLPLSGSKALTQTSDMGKDFESLLKDGEAERDWQAVRVDFVFIPQSQWAYALLGWSGSKLYMRMLRHYANKNLQMMLNSHGLWSRANNALLPAKDEAEVFKNLGLNYKEPCDRNF